MEYLTGDKSFANGQKHCLVVGFKSDSSRNPHHRASSPDVDASKQNDGRQNKYLLVGALCGGPVDANGTYQDIRSDYQGNEVALDYNAGFVGAAAGLYHFYKTGSIVSNIEGVKTYYKGETVIDPPSGSTTTQSTPKVTTSTTKVEPYNPPAGGDIVLYPEDMSVGVDIGTDNEKNNYAEFAPQGAKSATLYLKVNTNDTEVSGGFGTWTGKWEQEEFQGVKVGSDKTVAIDYTIPSNVGSTVKAMVWWPHGDGVTIQKVVLHTGNSSNITTTRTNPRVTTTTTKPQPTNKDGEYTLKVNKKITYSDLGENDRMIGFAYEDFGISKGETIKEVQVNISANRNIGTYVGQFGTSTTDKAAGYWAMGDEINQSISSNSGTITWKVPSDIASIIQTEYGGEVKFGVWWIDCDQFTIDSVTLKTSGSSSVQTTTTTRRTTTTTKKTTTTTRRTTTTTAPKVSGVTIYGDANNDGSLDMSDVVIIMQALANPNKYGLNGSDSKHITQQGWANADVHRNGNGVTANDALAIQKKLLGLISSLPTNTL